MKKYKFGIIGLGSISQHHINSILDLENATLVAVCSRNTAKLKEAATTYHVATYTDFNTMFQETPLDVVCICTPSGFHLEPTLAAAKTGVHVIVEKPLEINVARSALMKEACNKAQVQLATIFQNRWSEDFIRTIEILKEGKLGKIVLGNAYVKWYRPKSYYQESDWRGTLKGDGGAALINQAIHTIDLLIHIMSEAYKISDNANAEIFQPNNPIVRVSGQTSTLFHDIEGEDLAVGHISFDNGAIGTIEASTTVKEGFPARLEIHGTEGSIVLENNKIVHSTVALMEQNSAQTNNDAASDPMAFSYQLHKNQLNSILDAITNNTTVNVSYQESIQALKVIEAIYTSAKTAKKIDF